MENIEFCKLLPKIELHAHLNGSFSTSCLESLGCSNDEIVHYQKLTQQLTQDTKDLEECFSLFKIAHKATNNLSSIYEATKYVIKEFANDNVVYLELRTTPKDVNNFSKIDYIEAVIKGIKENQGNIITKLILSIDRAHDDVSSQKSLDIIIEMKKKYPEIIKAVDLCGNPAIGYFNTNLFKQAVDNDLFTTIHCGEVKNNSEIDKILSFGPDRIGHGTFLHPQSGGSQENWDLYINKKIPLECCLTSNVLCGTVKDYKEHHLQEWMKQSLPFSLCTDDKGVFGTNLSQEHFLAQQHFGLTNDDLWKINFEAISFCFANDEEKSLLKKIFHDWKIKHLK